MTRRRIPPRVVAAMALFGCFLVGYTFAAAFVLSCTETASVHPMEIELSTRLWMLCRLLLGPFTFLGLTSGLFVPAVLLLWSAILLFGLVLPPRITVLPFSCIAAFLWPLAALVEWSLIVA